MITPLLSWLPPRPRGRSLRRLLTGWGLVLACSSTALAQFPRIESFKNTTTSGSGFRLGGNPNAAVLTTNLATNPDANGAGYLRLTDNSTNQAGFAIDNASFPAPSGFSISFEFFSYGGTGADGFSVFLIDADKTSAAAFTSGASGGSLGYAQKTVAPISNGVPNGYVGIGIDEFGNFANPTEGRVGGPGVRPDAVSLRGAGNGQSATDYPYLAGSGTLPFSLDVTTPRAPQGTADFRRAYIDVIPQPNGTYQITVRIQHGNAVTTAVNRVTISAPPANLRIGFAGSTGGSTNFHEIRNLAIVKAPFANDDVAGTKYNVPTTVNILSNDVAQGSNLDLASVDLDPSTTVIDNSYTVAGQGTFNVNSSGVLTFTPSGTFAGVVTIPYTVADVTGTRSSPANIIIIVTGADLTTSVSGPSSASPGSQITYTVTTANQGTETATAVVPTLQLTPNLPAGNVSLPAGANYNPASGLVTFAQIASLSSTDAAVVNAVRVTVPTSGTASITAQSNVSSAIPDPVAGNNTATLSTTITGLSNVATACATPGKDGVGSLTASSVPNTYYPVASGTTLTTNSSPSITLGAATAGATAIQVGDLLMLVQMQGSTINTTNTTAYGAVANDADFKAGVYEYAVAATAVPLTGGTLTLAAPLKYSYENTDYNGTISGQRRFQVIRVPQYSSLTLTGAVTGKTWDGTTGGVLALDVAGRTTFSTGASLTMNGKGFRGGGGRSYAGNASASAADYRSAAGLVHGSKGEGLAGTPRFTFTPGGTANSAVVDNTQEGYLNGSNAAGAPGNAGGGATDQTVATNSGNAGGGGGANAGSGGLGGYGSPGASGTRAQAGNNVSSAAAITRLFAGGGGGAGSSNDAGNAYLSSGAAGGGIILFRTGVVSGTGTIVANGDNALAGGTTQGGGGGGAGGTLVVLASPPTGVTASGLTGLTLAANGGNGGTVNNAARLDSYGPGGGGGGGYIYTNGAVASTTVTPGTNGLTNGGNGNNLNSIAYGSTAGTAGASATNAIADAVMGGAGSCLPALTASLATTTPTVSRVGDDASAVRPATFTLTVSNTGGAVTDLSTLTSLPTVFGYDNTFTPVVTITRANGTTYTPSGFTVPANGVSTPSFGGFALPAGATLSITFRTTIAASAVNNFAYQSSTALTYSNPLRDASATTVAPGGNYAGGTDTSLGAAGGSNYSASSSTNEDVTITRPLPVTLTSFEAKAAGQDAVLTWATAQELNNDRFEVERSFNGVDFELVGTVRGKGTTTTASAYRYLDAGAGRLSSKPLYYRLRQVDLDGPGTYSMVRTVRFERAQGTVTLYPNPHQGRFTLDLQTLPAGPYQIDVLDLAGRRVYQTQLSGGQEHPLLPTLPMGSYIVRITGQSVNINLPMVKH